MARKSPSDLARDFFTKISRADAPAPIYYVYGEESYLLDHAVDALIKFAAPDGANDFNYDTFHGEDVTAEQLRSTVDTLPFMSKRRVVVLRDVQEMDLNILEDMVEYFENPAPSTCLIMHALTAEKSIDGRRSAVRKLKKAAESCEFKAFYERDVENFLRKQAGDRGLRLDNAAQAYLLEAVGQRLADIDAALEKLDLFIGEADGPRRVDADQVREIIADTKINTVFDLTDALGDKQLEEALRILTQMMRSGEAAIKIMFMVARHFRLLAKLQDPSLRNANRSARAKAIGVHSFFLKDYERHAQKFSAQRVEQILDRLVEVDRQLKSSKLDERIIVEQLVFEIVKT